MEIIVRKYEGFNHAMGKYITSRQHYEKEMVKGGYVPFDKAQQMAEKVSKRKEYKPSDECRKVVNFLLDKKDKKIVLGDYPKIVETMRKRGVKFDIPKNLSIKEGGFNAGEK